MKEIWNIIIYTKRFKKFYFGMGAFVIALSLLNQLPPIFTKQIVDLIVARLKNQSVGIQSVFLFLGLILLVDLLTTVLTVISQYIGDLMTVKLNNYLSEKFYRHVLSLSIDYYDSEVTGKIVNKLERGILNITQLIQQSMNNFLPFFVSTIITLFIIAIYSWELAILLFALFPIYIIISHKSSVAWGEIEAAKNALFDVANGRVFEALSSIRVVKSFVSEALEFDFFQNTRGKIYELTMEQSKEWHKYDAYRRFFLNVIMFGVFSYIIYFTFKGRFTIGEMTLLLQFSNQARFPLFAMSFIIGQIQQAQAGSKDFFQVLETPVAIKDKKDAKTLKNVKGTIAFGNVNFSYKKGARVLHDISFSLRAGEKLAIVGESGEGKSTIANLLLRFYEPTSGEILIDSNNIADVTQYSLRQNIGVVFQDTFLFSGTIMDNIKYGTQKKVSENEIKEVARIANATEFISKLPKGFDSEIGERGIKLSGGQKQRIAIARALLKDPPILIFDEATSSLDSKAEFEVQKALNKLMEGRTTLVIAHRLSTIKHVDYIVVLKNGKIVEQGKPKELEKQNGVYAELLSYQNLGVDAEEKLKEFNIEGV